METMQEPKSHHDYWDAFYRGRISSTIPSEPSSFARWVHEQLAEGETIAEFGFGNGRDSLWFARQGRSVIGFDFAESAVESAQRRADEHDPRPRFQALDLYDVTAVEAAAELILRFSELPSIYGRFLIHSLEADGRRNFFDLAATVLPGRGSLYLEFRTSDDRETAHVFGDTHYRAYLDPARVLRELEQRGGVVRHCELGRGLATFGSEDPHIARIVTQWNI